MHGYRQCFSVVNAKSSALPHRVTTKTYRILRWAGVYSAGRINQTNVGVYFDERLLRNEPMSTRTSSLTSMAYGRFFVIYRTAEPIALTRIHVPVVP